MFFPKGSRIILNKLGSAWGFVMETQGRKIISLPGVAREFETMIQGEIMPKLFLKRGGLSRPVSLTAMAAGISELEFLKRLGGAPREKFVDCGIYPGLGEVRFTAASKGSKESNQAVSRLKEKIKKKLGSYVYAWNLNTSLEQEIAKLLVKKHHTVSCAESCTGGHVSELLTQTPGSSKYFLGGVVAYADAVKEQSVGIPHGIMHRHGAVSREVGEEMAQRIRRRMCSSIGIGITGIAGPSGATKTKPLGLVYISIAGAKRVETRKFVFKGNRERIRKLAAKYALYLLWLKIRSGSF
ncbi:MAG: nicotinamide-nucleotide amidohydrolase family protein [Candidatus Omnitrophica bacterium]|nr:nicotinamide-nucleotide amidohydrolase family protein [Candidatus Omnitrophota bacterium]